MSQPVKFGRQATERPPFTINELSFASTPLSLAEERQLAQAGEGQNGQDETRLMDALLGTLSSILNARIQDDSVEVDAEWLLENLSPADLEGIVEHLRGEAAES